MKKIKQTGKEKKCPCSLLPPTQSGKHMGCVWRKVPCVPVFLNTLKHPAIPTHRFSSL